MPAAVNDEYRCFVIPARFEKDTWYEGFELRPGNARVVHHAVAWGVTSDEAVERDRATPEPGFLCGPDDPGAVELHGMGMIAGWVPGNQQTWENSDGVASRIPGGVATVVMQIHYHNATGEDQPDRTAVAFYLARETVQKEPHAEFLGAWGDALFVPAGNPRVEHRTEWTAPQDITLRALVPHMHKLGTDMTVSVTYPDGREEVLLERPALRLQLAAHLSLPRAGQAAQGHGGARGVAPRQLGRQSEPGLPSAARHPLWRVDRRGDGVRHSRLHARRSGAEHHADAAHGRDREAVTLRRAANVLDLAVAAVRRLGSVLLAGMLASARRGTGRSASSR